MYLFACVLVFVCMFKRQRGSDGTARGSIMYETVKILPGQDGIVLTGGPATETERSGVRKGSLCISSNIKHRIYLRYINQQSIA